MQAEHKELIDAALAYAAAEETSLDEGDIQAARIRLQSAAIELAAEMSAGLDLAP